MEVGASHPFLLPFPCLLERIALEHILHAQFERRFRPHLDIETDDIEAEAERLERLGARKIERLPRWWVMEAPSGQRFCVVSPQRSTFEEDANPFSQKVSFPERIK